MLKQKKRRKVRLREYDYSQTGGYFITICTFRKRPLFGTLLEDTTLLNELGLTAKNMWQYLPNKYPSITIDEFIIMPDHMHGLLIFGDTKQANVEQDNAETVGAGFPCLSPNQTTSATEKRRRNDAPTLGSAIGYFKYQCAKQVNLIRKTPGAPVWQRNYYEHVIRNEDDLANIRKYIKYNPQKIEY